MKIRSVEAGDWLRRFEGSAAQVQLFCLRSHALAMLPLASQSKGRRRIFRRLSLWSLEV
jgi:hypothetical protein